jgi:hypothetical protein
MQAMGNKECVSGATDDTILSELKGQLPREYAKRLVEGMVMEWRTRPAGPYEILDDPERSIRVAGGESDMGGDQRHLGALRFHKYRERGQISAVEEGLIGLERALVR